MYFVLNCIEKLTISSWVGVGGTSPGRLSRLFMSCVIFNSALFNAAWLKNTALTIEV